jgi:hypothetical protein
MLRRDKWRDAYYDWEMPMASKSPTVERILTVLSFFLENSREAFSIAQVTKSLGLSRTTVAAILAGLEQEGYLYRRSDRACILGRALHSLAASSSEPLSPLAVASQEMRSLADKFGVIAGAFFLEGDEMVVRERAASVHHLGRNPLMARRFPTAPWYLMFGLKVNDEKIIAKVREFAPKTGKNALANVLAGVHFFHRHGFIARCFPENRMSDEAQWWADGIFLTDIKPATRYEMAFIFAPVVRSSAGPAVGIGLYSFREPMTGAEVMQAGQLLRAACARIQIFMSGTSTQ